MGKQLVIFLLVMGWVVQSLAVNSEPAKSSTIVLSAKQPDYRLQLPSNPSTGYSWFVKSYDPHFLTIVNHRYQKSEGKKLGSGGKEVWQLRALPAAFKAPMLLELDLVYARPWLASQSSVHKVYIITH